MSIKRKTVIIVVIISTTALWYAYSAYTGTRLTPQEQEMKQRYEDAIAYEKEVKKIESEYNALLKADNYGGATPEETLALFVEALKAKDAALAGKYYMPQDWEKAIQDMRDWVEDDSMDKFIQAYENGLIGKDKDYIGGVALEIKDAKDDKYPYILEMQLNNINNIWKIKKF